MGQRFLLSCRSCHDEIAFDLGSGMIQPNFTEVVGQKRTTIRREVALLVPLMVPHTFQSDLVLFQCGKCGKYYNRRHLQFGYLQCGTLKTYQASEVCTQVQCRL
jgi:hypothetical protein